MNRGYEESHLFTKVDELISSYPGYLMNRFGAARLLQAISGSSFWNVEAQQSTISSMCRFELQPNAAWLKQSVC